MGMPEAPGEKSLNCELEGKGARWVGDGRGEKGQAFRAPGMEGELSEGLVAGPGGQLEMYVAVTRARL